MGKNKNHEVRGSIATTSMKKPVKGKMNLMRSIEGMGLNLLSISPLI